MGLGTEPAGRRPEALVVAFERLSTGVTSLVRDHLELARLELRQGARTYAREGARALLGAALVGIGYLLLMVALALALGSLPGALAFLLVGLGNALLGGALLSGRLRALTREEPAPESLPPA